MSDTDTEPDADGCITPGCVGRRAARGVCNRCYQRLLRRGQLDDLAAPPVANRWRITPEIRARVQATLDAELLATAWTCTKPDCSCRTLTRIVEMTR